MIHITKNEFFFKWLENFASDIPEKDIKRYVEHFGNYIWHVFSWDLLDKKQYLIGEDAKKEYDKTDKKGAFYIEWFKDNHTKDITWALNTAEALDDFVEIYIVGKNFEWTYIKTHEHGLGPYFFRKK